MPGVTLVYTSCCDNIYAILKINRQFTTKFYCQSLLFTTSLQPTWPSSGNTKNIQNTWEVHGHINFYKKKYLNST
jgi:hypothetical protein